MTSNQPEKTPDNDKTLLTSIHGAYTVSATQDGGTGEVDRLMVRQFLNTLAEVALSVASRKAGK